MRRALIVTDLEGVHGADDVEALIGGTAAWQRSRLRATHEVNLVVDGLARQGFTSFVVSDSHRNGTDTPNLVLEVLDRRVRYERRDDAFSPELFSDVHAVAALGMHAGGGVEGYVSHALDVTLAWELESRLLSETDFLLDLCAQAYLPFLFVSGDEALGRSLPAGVRHVATKRVLSATRARSFELALVEQSLLEASLIPPSPAPALPGGVLRMHVKSPAFEVPDLPALSRESDFVVRVEGASARSRYANALVAVECASAALEAFVTRRPDDEGFLDEIAGLVSAPWPSLRPT